MEVVDVGEADLSARTRQKLDPALLGVLRHRLVGVAEEMNLTMRRTTRSVLAKETNDFSSAVLDASGTIVGQAFPYGLPVFASAVPCVIEKVGHKFRPGDVVITNDPYGGGSHLPDILVVMPVFWRHELVAFVATYQHHTDMGGRFPGGRSTASKQLYEEGLRLPAVLFYREGQPEASVHEIIAANVRAPADVLGDLEANVAACRRGARGMLELLEKYGRETVEACCDHLVEASANRIREIIRSIPNGTYRVEDVFEDGLGLRFDLVLTLIVDGDSMTVDLTGCAPQVDAALNIPAGYTAAHVFQPLLGLLADAELVVNSGLMKGFRVIAPLGTVVNPLFPAAVAARGLTGTYLTAMMYRALATAAPGRIPAQGDTGSTHLVYSPSRRNGGTPAMLNDIWQGGWGARAKSDGIDGVGGILLSGFRTSSGEQMELETPVALMGFGFVPDTGGAGTFRGNVSVFRRFLFKEDGRVMFGTKRATRSSSGLEGGHDGSLFSAKLIRDGVETLLPRQTFLDFPVEAGDVIEHVMASGGGFGDPVGRDPERVLEDVLDEKVTPAVAERVYRVAVDVEAGTVDIPKTMALRRSAPG